MKPKWTCPECGKTLTNVHGIGGHMKHCSVTHAQVFWTKVNKSAPNGCWEWTGHRQRFGHGRLHLGGNRWSLAHRYAWELLRRPLKDTDHLLHKCDNPPCVNPDHLYVGDNAQNMADKVERGNLIWGDLGRHKLTREQAMTVLREYRMYGPRKSNARELAARFGVKPLAITNIAFGRSWKRLDRSSLFADEEQSNGR